MKENGVNGFHMGIGNLKMITEKQILNRVNVLSFGLISMVFYLMAYYSVSEFFPNSTPVHHDDYTNYSSAAAGLTWTWTRPLSTWIIFLLSSLGPDWLIWAVRLFTVMYVFLSWKILTEVWLPRPQWMTLILFAMASLSSPIVVEYARYTGMITHMISGSLGLASVYFMFKNDREKNDTWLYVSIILFVFSALAKEDFILFCVFSFIYVLLKSKKPIKKQAVIGLIGLSCALLMVAGAKFLAASSFLGTSDEHSSYFLDASPSNVAMTVWRYLTGAGHPSMTVHGAIIAGVMICSSGIALILILRDRTIPKTLYFVGAALTLIAPYSVLPNHVNAYYELIWLPFILGAACVALSEVINTDVEITRRTYLASTILIALCVSLFVVDAVGRTSIAHWYDVVGADNAKLFRHLEDNREAINSAPSVCVSGANAFSPWYLHNGEYLRVVIGLHSVWHIITDKNSQLYPGFQQAAASSRGRIIVSDASEANASCLKLQIGAL
jgi:hypothetical protein